MRKRNALMSFGLSVALMTTSLTGCGILGGNSVPKNAEDMFQKYKEAFKDAGSYRMKGKVDLKFSIALSGNADEGSANGSFNIDVPVKMDLDMAGSTANDKLHGNVTLNMDASGISGLLGGLSGSDSSSAKDMKKTMKGELYVDAGDKDAVSVYAKESESESWNKTVVNESDENAKQAFEVMKSLQDMDFSMFKDASFEKGDSVYTVSSPLSALLDDDKIKGMINDAKESGGADSVLGSAEDLDTDDILKQLGEGKVNYVFDKDTNLLSKVTLSDLKYSGKPSSGDSSFNMDIGLEMSMDLSFSDYGKVEEKEYTVPDDVKKDAKEETSVGDSMLSPIIDSGQDDGTSDVDAAPSANPDVSQDAAASAGDIRAMTFGYNGTQLTVPFSMENLYNDGWVPSEKGNLAAGKSDSSVIWTNEKYPNVTTYAQLTNPTQGEVPYEKCNVTIYSLDVSTCSVSDDRPEILLPGNLKWGASEQAAQDAYGTPDNTYDGDLYTSYSYNLPDYKGVVELYFYKEGKGLNQIRFQLFD